MISILVNSHRPDMAEATRAMYARLLADRPYELIVISDARSMCEGYSRAMKAARGEIIVFAHHDLEYLFDDFAAVLERSIAQYDLIGVAGTDELVHPIWTAAGIGRLFGQIVHPASQGGFDVEVYGAPGPSVGGMVAMDGLFLAARREVAQAIGWDAESFGGWDFYDIDFTYRAARAGYRLGVIPELGFFHQSKGAGSADYAKYAQRFAAKHRESIRFRQFPPLQVAKQHVASLEEARAIMRPPFWHR